MLATSRKSEPFEPEVPRACLPALQQCVREDSGGYSLPPESASHRKYCLISQHLEQGLLRCTRRSFVFWYLHLRLAIKEHRITPRLSAVLHHMRNCIDSSRAIADVVSAVTALQMTALDEAAFHFRRRFGSRLSLRRHLPSNPSPALSDLRCHLPMFFAAVTPWCASLTPRSWTGHFCRASLHGKAPVHVTTPGRGILGV